jgi:hypothetical protein
MDRVGQEPACVTVVQGDARLVAGRFDTEDQHA